MTITRFSGSTHPFSATADLFVLFIFSLPIADFSALLISFLSASPSMFIVQI